MSSIDDLNARKTGAEREFGRMQNEMTSITQQYDDLRHFKIQVEQAQGVFDGIKRRGEAKLEPLEPILPNCRTARVYRDGMRAVLNGVGQGVVAGAYNLLLFNISRVLSDLMNRTIDLQTRMDSTRNLITGLENEIRQAEQDAAAADGESEG